MESWSVRLTRQMQARQRICGTCGKVSYANEQEAGRVIREYHDRMRRRPYYLRNESPADVPKRTYFDRRCQAWHITKQRVPHESVMRYHESWDVGSLPFLKLPPSPAAGPPVMMLEALTLSLRDEIMAQGPGLRLPFRRAMERHLRVSWGIVVQARKLLMETGWLLCVPGPSGPCYITDVPSGNEPGSGLTP